MERRLGRGLDSLIPRASAPAVREVMEVPVEAVTPNPDQPRKVFNEANLESLAASIRQHGVVQPIIVQATPAGFQLVAGERRLRASRMAGRPTIPALVVEPEGGLKSLEVALIENLQRENLGPLEEAAAYEALLEKGHLTHQEAADRLGRSRVSVTNSLRLLELPEAAKRLLNSGALSAGQGRAILAAASEADRERLAMEAVRHGWTVRDIEARARTLSSVPRRHGRGRRGETLKNASHYAEQLQILYGTRVQIRERGGRGEVALEFYTAADRDRLLHRLITAGSEVEDSAPTRAKGPPAE